MASVRNKNWPGASHTAAAAARAQLAESRRGRRGRANRHHAAGPDLELIRKMRAKLEQLST